MFKLAVTTDGLSQDFRRVTRFALECEVDAIEIGHVWKKPVYSLANQEDIAVLKESLKDSGILVSCLASSVFRCWIDSDDAYREHLRRLEACIKLAQALESPIIRAFAFLRSGTSGENWQRLLDRFEQIVKLLETHGVVLAIQNDAKTFLGTGREVARFVETIGSPYVKAVWDPSASVYDIDYPEIPYPDGYCYIKTHMVHMHARDVNRYEMTGALQETVLGEGLVDYHKQFRALIKDNYEGVVSLVTRWRPGMSWGRSYHYGDFSLDGAEQALCTCFKNLHNIIAQIRSK